MRAWIIGLAVLAVVGLVVVLVADSTALDAVGVALVGVAAVGAVSLGFFAVGRSEDVARADEEAQRAPRPTDDPGGGDGRLTSRRPPRSRGRLVAPSAPPANVNGGWVGKRVRVGTGIFPVRRRSAAATEVMPVGAAFRPAQPSLKSSRRRHAG